MLQNPSKYHANPLTHFLALHHNTQLVHNSRPPLFPSSSDMLINTTTTTSTIPTTTPTNETISQHFQQQQQQLNYHQPPIQQQQQQHNHFDVGNSSLDAGKSFTIAAILGLQKNALENGNNSVINLSMNDNQFTNNNHNSHNYDEQQQFMKKHNNNKNNHNNQNNNNNNKLSNFNNLHRFDNEKLALMNRYLPNTSKTQAVAASKTPTSIINEQQQQQRASNFVAAVAAVTNANGAPSALESLQQLHQHHVQQNNLSFPRDKPKENSKRSALKNKRVRTIFTPEQLERLEAEFERQQYMVGPERLYLAHTLQLTEAQVKVWFQNRRIKWRKHHLEITHQRLAILRQSQVPLNPNAPLDVVGTNLESQVADDSNDMDKYGDEDVNKLVENRQASESDLSICNDSLDNDSADNT